MSREDIKNHFIALCITLKKSELYNANLFKLPKEEREEYYALSNQIVALEQAIRYLNDTTI